MNVRESSLLGERTDCERAWRREKERLAIYSLKKGYGLKRIVSGGAESRQEQR